MTKALVILAGFGVGSLFGFAVAATLYNPCMQTARTWHELDFVTDQITEAMTNDDNDNLHTLVTLGKYLQLQGTESAKACLGSQSQ